MPRFHYRALQPSGVEIAGELVGDSERDVAARLQAGGNFPIEIGTTAAGSTFAPRWRPAIASNRVAPRDLALFTRQLATLATAGVALDRGLGLIAAGAGRRAPARLARDLLAAVNRGESLSRACRDHPGLPRHYAMMIAAGEARGDLGAALDRLADVLEKGRAASRALVGALIYPASVFVVACLSVSFLLAFVVPRFEGLLTSFRHEPPWTMRLLLGASALFQETAVPALVILLALAAFVAIRWRDPGFRAAIDRRLLALPGLGGLIGKAEAERLTFLLGNLIGAGVPVPNAAAASAAAMTHQSFRDGLAAAQRRIERGDGVAAALGDSGVLPDLAGELVRAGEETGDLAPMLLKASDILRREVEAASTELIGLVTPVAILLLGLLIGTIAVAMLGTVMDVYDIGG
ncbi:MAG TPA: type II secretion system F family protein [Stellaceae bacterium]|jgi:general secretion pathway protein F|nr:type II secretion system F family protein [Stellaceae bacterium]